VVAGGVRVREAEEAQSSERKSWLLARSEGLAEDQRAMNAVAESVGMAGELLRKEGRK
jgi:hypothetical protein